MPAKPFKLEGLKLDGLIVHEIRKGSSRHESDVAADLSPSEAPPDEATLDFLNRQVRNGMTSYGLPATITDGPADSGAVVVGDVLRSNLAGRQTPSEDDLERFVGVSRALAERLQAVQEHNSPGGMFAFCRGSLRGGPLIAVMKLESQDGLKLVRGEVFSLEVDHDLFVGSKAKLFKAAVMWLDGDSVRVMMCDEQMGKDPSHPAARFFVRELFGCTVDDNAQVRTSKFFDVAAQATSLLEDPSEKERVLSAIRHEIERTEPMVDPQAFIQDNFPQEKRAAAEQLFKRNELDVNAKFRKDVSTVERRFRRTTYRFDENGPSVIAADSAVTRVPSGKQFDTAQRGVQIRYEGDEAVMFIRGKINRLDPRS